MTFISPSYWICPTFCNHCLSYGFGCDVQMKFPFKSIVSFHLMVESFIFKSHAMIFYCITQWEETMQKCQRLNRSQGISWALLYPGGLYMAFCGVAEGCWWSPQGIGNIIRTCKASGGWAMGKGKYLWEFYWEWEGEQRKINLNHYTLRPNCGLKTHNMGGGGREMGSRSED